ncbi:MAG: PaaI family thioesterase [Candidatus Melainabacteria bacterium]|nr:PaaI family thioesterase [Candidatus Melainabacteria bacterium]
MPVRTFDKYLGLKLVSRKKGYYKVKLALKPEHLNNGGIAHGGMLATLFDVVLAGAINTVMDKKEFCVTANLNIDYVNPAFPGELYAKAKVTKRGNTLAFVEGVIETENRVLIAKANGIWVIKSKPIKGTKKIKRME